MKSIFKPLLYAALGFAPLLSLSGCGAGDTAEEFGAGYDYLDAGKGAADAYPNLKPFEAQRRHAADQYKIIADRQDTAEGKRDVAAAFYLGFALYNARALPAYCQEMNLYPKAFVDAFHKMNAREEAALDQVLAQNGTSQDAQWTKQANKMMGRAKYDLMGGNISPGSYASCKKIRDDSKFFLDRTHFQKQFPTISRALRQ